MQESFVMQIPFARLALAFAAVATVSQAAPIYPVYTLLSGASVNAVLTVPANSGGGPPEPNAEIPFMSTFGGIRVSCTNCAGDPIRRGAAFVFSGTGALTGNYTAFVPNVPFDETYDLTLHSSRFVPDAPISDNSIFKIVHIPEPSTWLLMACGLALIAVCVRLNEFKGDPLN